MKHVIIGTAGHVDHGKTVLIKALTGIDTGLDSGTMTLHAGEREIPVCGSFTKRQAAMLRAGGLLNYTKEGND